jgi:hypothetical protein
MKHPKLENEKLFQRLYGKVPYDDLKLRRLRMKLKSLLENYLAIHYTVQAPGSFEKMLIGALNKSGDYGLFRESVEAAIERLEKQPYRGRDFHFQMAQLWKQLYEHPETDDFRPDNDYLRRHIFHLETYFAIATLQNGAESMLKQRVLNREEKPQMFEDVSKLAASRPDLAAQPVLHFFYMICQLFLHKDKMVALPALRESLDRNLPLLAPDEQHLAVKMLIYYATPFSNMGNREFTLFMFKLSQLLLAHDLTRSGQNNISPDFFMNIVVTAALVGEFVWAEKFLADYSPLLPEKDLGDTLCIAQASICYQKGMAEGKVSMLKDALAHLAHISSRAHERYNLRMRSLQIRIHFELFLMKEDGFDNVLELAKYFENHLNHNPNYSPAKKASYLRFINHLKSLFKLASNPNYDRYSYQRYLDKLSAGPRPILQHWLVEKAGELMRPPAVS